MSALDANARHGYELAVFRTQKIHTNGYKAALIVNTGPCKLVGFTVYSSNAAAQWIHVFDGTVAPATGVNPELSLTVLATANLGVYFGDDGLPFLNGCVIANSTTGPTFTAGAADTYISAQYRVAD